MRNAVWSEVVYSRPHGEGAEHDDSGDCGQQNPGADPCRGGVGFGEPHVELTRRICTTYVRRTYTAGVSRAMRCRGPVQFQSRG